jgi:hypothetical protein
MNDLEFRLIEPPVESDIDPLHKLRVAETPYGRYTIELKGDDYIHHCEPINGWSWMIGSVDEAKSYLNNIHGKVLAAAEALKG